MSTRRSRSSRPRKARASEAPPGDVSTVLPVAEPSVELARRLDPTETSPLRALEAGWDELLA